MSWNFTPSDAAALGGAAFLNAQPYVDQFWWALAERLQGAGNSAPFKQNYEYDTFHIDSIADNGDGTYTITDGSKSWITAAGHKRWTEATPGETGVPTWAATGYHAVIDADRSGAGLSAPDPRQVIRGAISDNTATTLRVSLPVATWIREGRISALSELSGRHGWIIRSGGYDWTRAFIDRPNGPMWSFGKVKASTAGTLTSDRAIQHAAGAVGRQVIYFAGGVMQRGSITAVDADTNTLSFTGTTADATVGASFYVVDAGAFWHWRGDDPTPTGPGIQCAFAGLTKSYYAHASGKTSDSYTTVNVPRLTYPVLYGTDPLSCPIDPEQWDVRASVATEGRDPDTFIPQDNACGAGDVLLMEKFWRCWRAIWSGLMYACESYCPRFIYDSANPPYIANFTVATALYEAGVNARSGTTGSVVGGGGGPSGTISCSLAVPHTPINLWWTICDDTGAPTVHGWTANYDGANLTGGPFTPGVHEGKTVKASLGPPRYVERAFARMLPGTYFLPGVDGDPAAAQSVSETFPGTWYTDPASTHYLMSDIDGIVATSALARHAVADGHVARYVGHRTMDPGFPVTLPADVPDPLAEYHNHGAVGRRTETVQKRLDGARSGTATGGSTRRLVVDGRDWDALDFYANTNGKTHSFTPTTGGTTSCTVPGASGSVLWASGRFPGFSGPMVGFCIEVLISGASFTDPAAVVERRLIATGTTGGAITWAEATSASVAGKSCRIVEPLVLNPWKGLPVKLTKADGTTATVAIEGNHGDTLFIPDPGFAVNDSTTYAIDVPKIGDVFMRVAGGWVTTSDAGADPRFGGSTFRKDASKNQPDVMIEYGLPLPMDVSPQFLTWHNHLYNFANAITDLIGPEPTWHGYAVDGTPEYNTVDLGGAEIYSVSRSTLHSMFGHLETPIRDHVLGDMWPAALPGSQDPAALPASAISHFIDEEFGTATDCRKSYAYLQIEEYALPEFFPVGISYRAYVWASIGGDPGPDPGETVTGGPYPALADRSVLYYDTSLGLPFRTWQEVGGGGPGTRVKVGGDVTTPPTWGEVLSEADINSIDHPDGTLATNTLSGGAQVVHWAEVCRMSFKFA